MLDSVDGHIFFPDFLLCQGKKQSADIVTYIAVMLVSLTIKKVTQKNQHTHTHTSGEEGTDHKAEVDGGNGEDKQEDKDESGVTVSQHSSIRAHLKDKKHSLVQPSS